MTEEIDKLIKELCEKEVKRTGLPLVYDEKETSEIKNKRRKGYILPSKNVIRFRGYG